MSSVTIVDLGAITEEQLNKVDIELYTVMDRLSMFDDVSASYQVGRRDSSGNYSDNQTDHVYVYMYDGFEHYWSASKEIGD